MIVKCEKCQTKFKIPDEKVTEKGVKVRCTKCQTVFRVKKSDGSGAGDPSTPPPKSAPPPLPQDDQGNPFNLPTRPGASMGVFSQPTRVASGPSSSRIAPKSVETSAAQLVDPDFSPADQTHEISKQLGLDPLQFLNELSSDPAPKTPPPLPSRSDEPDDPFALLLSGPSGTANQDSALADELFADSKRPPLEKSSLLGEPDRAEISFGANTLESGPQTEDVRPVASRLGRGFKPIARPVRVQTAERNLPTANNQVMVWAINLLLSVGLACLLFLFGIALANEGRLDLAALLNSSDSVGGRSDFAVEGVRSGQYETRSGGTVFFVRGEIQNRGLKATRAKVRVEILDGTQVVQSAEAIAGAAAGPEDLFGLGDPKDVVEMGTQLAKQSDEIAPRGRRPFTAVFYDFPPDLTGMRLKLSIQSLGPNETARR